MFFNSSAGHSARYTEHEAAATGNWMQFSGGNASFLRFDGEFPLNMRQSAQGDWSLLAWVTWDPTVSDGGSVADATRHRMITHTSNDTNTIIDLTQTKSLTSYWAHTPGVVDYPSANMNEITDANDDFSQAGVDTPINITHDTATLVMIAWDNTANTVQMTAGIQSQGSEALQQETMTGTDLNSAFVFWGGAPDATNVSNEDGHIGYMRNILYYNSVISRANFDAQLAEGPYGNIVLPGSPYVHLVDSDTDTSGNGRNPVNVGVTTGVTFPRTLIV